jgi:multicomponent Na+:H+ antiporter subunit G
LRRSPSRALRLKPVPTTNAVLDLLSIAAIGLGVFFFVAGTVGLLRFPDVYTRLHALTKADNLGLGLIVLGLLPQVDGVWTGVKLVLIWLLVLLSGSTVAQLIARSQRARDAQR